MADIKKESKSRCKCCLKNGGHIDMWAEYVCDGEVEVYGEMLIECFALPWAEPEDRLEHICNRCVQRLKASLSFRKEILVSQQILDRVLKQESTDDDGGTGSDVKYEMNDAIVEEYESSEYQEEILEHPAEYETEEDVQEEQTADEEVEYLQCDLEEGLAEADMEVEYLEDDVEATASVNKQNTKETKQKEFTKTCKYKKYSQQDMEEAVKMVASEQMSRGEAAQRYAIPLKTLAFKLKMKDSEDAAGDGTEKYHGRQKTSTNVKHYENIRSVLLCSNATPIKGHWGIGYACCFCDTQLADARDLKTHTLKKHDDETKADFMKGKPSYDFCVKLDVTDLKCVLCDENIDRLETFVSHLKEKHFLIMHDDIPNQIIPFKFDSEVLECAICSKKFDYFKLLNEHMNEHYSNFKCDFCERTFVNMTSLRMHKYRHQGGEFPCTFCAKVFKTNTRKTQHERVVHRLKSRAHKCGYCNQRFSDSVAKNKHENTTHGAEIKTFNCQACDASFRRLSSLKNHTQTYHLLHRPHACPVCNKAFTRKRDMETHADTHIGLRPYQCDVCSKSFTRQSNLKSHITKKHASDE